MKKDVRKLLADELRLLLLYVDDLLNEQFPKYNDTVSTIFRCIGRCETYAELLSYSQVDEQIQELFVDLRQHIRTPTSFTLGKIQKLRDTISSELDDIATSNVPRQVMLNFGSYREI